MPPRKLLAVWTIVVVATVAAVLAVHGIGEPGLRAAIRATARLSAFAIACAVARIRTREALIALAISHGVHYAAIAALAMATTPLNAHIDAAAIPVGAAIYALMIFAAVKPRRWAIYLLWTFVLIGFSSDRGDSWVYPAILLMLVAALVAGFIPRRAQPVTTT